MWVRRSRSAPLGAQLYDGIRDAILSGDLLPGARLPSTRVLASREGVARNTALRVYRQLLGEGYIVGRHGRGTFVAPELADDLHRLVRQRPPAAGRTSFRVSRRGERIRELAPSWSHRSTSLPYDFRYGRPSAEDFPHATWRRVLTGCMRKVSADTLDYGDPGGLPELREAIASHVADTRAVACDPDQVVVVHGSQQALALAAEVLIDPGDRVLVEDPGYSGASAVFRAAGGTIVPAPVGPDGLDISALDQRRIRSVRFAYVTPSHQFPTGVVMTLSHRLALLAWARRCGGWIFEDDYDSEFRFGTRPVESLQGLDAHGCVVYAGTFSKVLFPALRLGYLVLPGPLVELVRTAKAVADTGTAGLEQRVLAEFMRAGHFERHLRRSRTRNGTRRATLLDSLDAALGGRVEVKGANAGLHIMLRLPDIPVSEERRIVAQAASAGVGVYSPEAFFQRPTQRREASLLLGYASLSLSEIREGVARLARVVGRVERSSSKQRRTSAGRSSITK